ncbi:hypothetical protein [Paenibacillus catalpae]|uniref:hypothetical protein n=1 Tax=Paenibacillus catalpae TaxID=1045775 RepID=UPI000ADCEAA1|nr:hypothetical protein [Paenibacillus catalpae]
MAACHPLADGSAKCLAEGAATQITPNDGFAYRSPVMDGGVLLYARNNLSTNSSALVVERDGAAADLAGASSVAGAIVSTTGTWELTVTRTRKRSGTKELAVGVSTTSRGTEAARAG